MVKSLALNSNNDLYVGTDGNIAIAIGLNAVKQCCETAVRALLGEMIYSTDKGVPYFQTVFGQGNPNIPQFETAIRQTLLSVEGVTQVTNLIVLPPDANSTVTYQAEITTIYGQNTINGNFSV